MEELVLDTETTGLGEYDQVIELALVRVSDGEIMMNTLIRPTDSIPADATAIHGITDSDVLSAPTWPEIHEQFCRMVSDRVVHIYNRDFDLRIIRQTAEHFGLHSPEIDSQCVMRRYANEWRLEDDYRGGYKWQRLEDAVTQQGIDISDLALHRAASDCEITRRLLLLIDEGKVKPCPEYLDEQQRLEWRRRSAAARDSRRKYLQQKLLPPGVRIEDSGRKRKVIDDNGKEWPYFGSCPHGMKTLSRLAKRDADNYEFAGMCVSAYGDWGYVVKPVT